PVFSCSVLARRSSDLILRETDRLEHLRDPFPSSWVAVKERLAKLRASEGRDYIPFTRYQEICKEHGVAEEVSQATLVGFLHDLGDRKRTRLNSSHQTT